MIILAVDVGSKRVGVAITDILGIAHALDVFLFEDAVDKIVNICRQRGVERIVIGLPLNAEGEVGSAARLAIKFGTALEKALDVDGKNMAAEVQKRCACCERKATDEHLLVCGEAQKVSIHSEDDIDLNPGSRTVAPRRIVIEYWDEAFSTDEAQRWLRKAGLKRRRQRRHIDKMAALAILESYLRAKG